LVGGEMQHDFLPLLQNIFVGELLPRLRRLARPLGSFGESLVVGECLLELLLLIRRPLAEDPALELVDLLVMGLVVGRRQVEVTVSAATAGVALQEPALVGSAVLVRRSLSFAWP